MTSANQTKPQSIADLLGLTLAAVERDGDDEIIFTLDTGPSYKLYHQSDCCESVTIEDVVGDLSDLVASPLTMAEETTNGQDLEYGEHATWTFYRLATAKGYVTIRWCGRSNGYYSEAVDFGPSDKRAKPQ